MILSRLLDSITAQKKVQRDAELYRNLIRHEAKIGGQLFGPVQPGGRREFFCLDKHTWVWHEEWVDKNGQRQTKTTRYDVRPNGIIKSQNGHYQPVDKEEADRLREAAKMYEQRVKTQLYPHVA